MTIDQRAILVTGAASGMGRAVCERLARGGARVLAVDLDAGQLGWTQGVDGVSAFTADVSSESDNAAMAAEAERRLGGLDAAIFNAGITGGGTIDGMAFDAFRRVVEINLYGPIHGIRAVLPLLRQRERSAILVTSSTMGLGGDSENWAYGVSKHGLIGLVRSLSRELGHEGIRINALCPGLTRTGMTSMMEDLAPAHLQQLTAQVPLQRWASPDEMAAVMEFLISPAASYVNGHAMVADGGAITGTGLLPPKRGSASVIPADINEQA